MRRAAPRRESGGAPEGTPPDAYECPGSRRALRVVLTASASGVPVRRPTTTCLPRRAVRGVPGIHTRSPGWGGRGFSAASPLADQRSVPSFLLGGGGHIKGLRQVHRFRHSRCRAEVTRPRSSHPFRALWHGRQRGVGNSLPRLTAESSWIAQTGVCRPGRDLADSTGGLPTEPSRAEHGDDRESANREREREGSGGQQRADP